jgi:hypothetical protein
MAESELSSRGLGFTGAVIELALVVWLFTRVFIFSGLALAMFLVAFLGYFTVPFFILGAIVLLIAVRSTLTAIGRFINGILG